MKRVNLQKLVTHTKKFAKWQMKIDAIFNQNCYWQLSRLLKGGRI